MISSIRLRSRAIRIAACVVLGAGSISVATVAHGAEPASPAEVPAPLSASQGVPHTITWDKYSLMIDGKRTFIWSGEFHYFRLPSPSLWTDVLEKMKAAGFNAVSLYFDWAYHSPKQGVYDFTGVRDVGKLLDIADQLGIYVLARPGPYINAELDAGGVAGWELPDQPLRTSTACSKNCPPWGSYQAQANDWLHHVDSILVNHQLTNGTGSVIAYQIENETSCTAGAQATYMSNLAAQVRGDGITVPLFVNNVNLGGQCVPSSASGSGGTRVDWNDLYGYDNYPQGFNCGSPYSWSTAASNETNFRNFDSSTPIFIPEFQGGSFDNWGGPSYESCRTLVNAQFERVFYLTNVANDTSVESNYMTFGGTSWGWEPVNNTVYSGYDYGSAITEGRLLANWSSPGSPPWSGKYPTVKELGWMFQSIPSLLHMDVGSSVTATNVSPAATTSCTNGPSGGSLSNCGAITAFHQVDSTTGTNIYFVRHNESRSTTDSTFNVPISTADGSYTVPQSGTDELNGRDMKLIVADMDMDTQHLVYTTSQIFTHAAIAGQDVQLLWAPKGQSGETVLRYSQQPTVTTLSGTAPAVTWDDATGDLRLNYTHDGLTEVKITGGGNNPSTGLPTNPLVLLLADEPTAGQFWVQNTSAGTVLEMGPELVRSASVSGATLGLTGDTSVSATLKAWAPAGVTNLTWNGAAVPAGAGSDGSLTTAGQLAGPPQLTLPVLTNWRYQLEAPEAQPSFDDSSWTLANHTVTNNNTNPPSGQSVLYSDDYGFHYGDVWYRFHATVPTDVTSISIGSEPGARGISEVWLNGTFLGSHDQGSSETNTTSYTVPPGTTRIGSDNVLSVLVRNMSHNEFGAPATPNPRGLTAVTASLAGGGTVTSNAMTVRIQGDQGGENIVDTVRGVQNNGGLYGERAGWYLPGYPDPSWQPVTLPANDPNPGMAWYRTTFPLHEPAGVDVSLALNITDQLPQGRNYRATIFLNGWNLGQYLSNTGPQHNFVLPNGILHTGQSDDGQNTLAIAVINYGTSGGGLGTVTLTGAPSVYTYDDTDPALQYDSASWSHQNTGVNYTGGDYMNTESFSNVAGASVSATFNGTAVRWISNTDSNHGFADVYLDGTRVAQNVDTYGSAKRWQQVFYQASGLSPGQHTLQIVVDGTHNASSSDNYVVVDAIDVPPAGVVEGGVPVTDVDSPGYAAPTVSANSFSSLVGSQLSGTLGHVSVPADAAGTAFAARVDWGDGTSSDATLTRAGDGDDVSAAHTYSASGAYPLTITALDSADGVGLASGSATVIAYAFSPGGGSFAVGDGSATGQVLFWADTWDKANTVSGGPVPPAFKGFVSSPAAPACGSTWNSRVGGSSLPPAGPLPAYLAVIVTDQVTQSGVTITGDTTHLEIVHTDPGYGPDPTQHGTGTVVATIC